MKHTISWRPVLFMATGILLLALVGYFFYIRVINGSKEYPGSSEWKNYAGYNINFSYPSSWKFQDCKDEGVTFKFPGTIIGQYKTDNYPLSIYGTTMNDCIEGKMRIEYSPENQNSINEQCAKFNRGEELANGLFLEPLEFGDGGGQIWHIAIRQNYCYTQYNESLFDFGITDPHENVGGEQILKYGGEPRVDKEKLFASQQYKDIKRFAESIELK